MSINSLENQPMTNYSQYKYNILNMDLVISVTNSLLICHHLKQTATHKTQQLRRNGQDARHPEGHDHFVHMHMPHVILHIA